MSGKIKVLDAIVANRITAGEVVERPASVVKELVENALDAGASKIVISVEKGGKRLIRVTDNGMGMSSADAELSLQRHATSKVRTTEDISRIATLGFRGEALPSIASVSRFQMVTRTAEGEAGTEILVEGGKVRKMQEVGVPIGTEIEVHTLFSHIPARRKFLKTDNTEWGHIDGFLRRCALCHPQVHWEWRHNSANWNRYPAVATLDERTLQLFGKAWHADTLPLIEKTSRHGWVFRGRVSQPAHTRSSRNEQYWFINGRPVVHAGLSYALQEAFGAHISKGSHPFGVFFLELPMEDVDVNVHPAKREVRLRNETAVRRMINETVNQLLHDWSKQKSEATRISILAKVAGQEADMGVPVPDTPATKKAATLKIDHLQPEQAEWQEKVAETRTPSADITSRNETVPGLKLLGKTEPGLILAESDEGLVLVHIQAAFERIYFEELMERFAQEEKESQALLVPVSLEFPPELAAFVQEAQSYLGKAGISIASLGGNAFMVDALPAAVSSRDPEHFVRQVVDTLSESGDRLRTAQKLQHDRVAAALAKHMSRGRRTESDAELNWLLHRLYDCDLPYTRPDGRPTMILLSRNEFRRRFQVD
ncbi:MAG: DNA mismatch repair endonuclease MutL [Verrucomicrobiota bacterium]